VFVCDTAAFGLISECSSRTDGDMASAMVLNPRTWAANKINVPVERILDEAQGTGDLNLSGRRLKEFPRCRKDFALGDTLNAGLHPFSIRYLAILLFVCAAPSPFIP